MIKNFKKGFAGDYRVKMIPRKLHNLCELHWPSFEVGWLPEGTLDLPTIQAVYQVVPGTPGHPDQFPHIDSLLLITQTMPLWARFNGRGQSRVFVAQPLRKKKEGKKIYIPGISSGRPTASPTKHSPDSTSLSTASTRPIARQSTCLHVHLISKPVGKQLCLAERSSQLAMAHQMPL